MIKAISIFDSYCDGCPYLETETSVLKSLNGVEAIYVSCEHRELCSMLISMIHKMRRVGVKDV